MRVTIQGRVHLLLSTLETDLFTQDTWRDLGHAAADVFAVGVVMLVRPRLAYATVEPFIPYGHLYALGWEVEPPSDPEARFLEALRQERLRAEERMTGETGLAPLPRR